MHCELVQKSSGQQRTPSDRRKRDHDHVHEYVYGGSEQSTRNEWTIHENRKRAAPEIVDRRGAERDEEMEPNPEYSNRSAAFECVGAQGAARDELEQAHPSPAGQRDRADT